MTEQVLLHTLKERIATEAKMDQKDIVEKVNRIKVEIKEKNKKELLDSKSIVPKDRMSVSSLVTEIIDYKDKIQNGIFGRQNCTSWDDEIISTKLKQVNLKERGDENNHKTTLEKYDTISLQLKKLNKYEKRSKKWQLDYRKAMAEMAKGVTPFNNILKKKEKDGKKTEATEEFVDNPIIQNIPGDFDEKQNEKNKGNQENEENE